MRPRSELSPGGGESEEDFFSQKSFVAKREPAGYTPTTAAPLSNIDLTSHPKRNNGATG